MTCADDRARARCRWSAAYLLIVGGGVQHWLEPVGRARASRRACTPSRRSCSTLITLLVVALGVLGGWVAFGTQPVPTSQPVGVSPVTTLARRNLFADAFNEVVLMRPGQWLTRALVFFDNRGVDGAVNGLAAGLGGGSARLRRMQTGFVRSLRAVDARRHRRRASPCCSR